MVIQEIRTSYNITDLIPFSLRQTMVIHIVRGKHVQALKGFIFPQDFVSNLLGESAQEKVIYLVLSYPIPFEDIMFKQYFFNQLCTYTCSEDFLSSFPLRTYYQLSFTMPRGRRQGMQRGGLVTARISFIRLVRGSSSKMAGIRVLLCCSSAVSGRFIVRWSIK